MRVTSFHSYFLMILFWLFPFMHVQGEKLSKEIDKGYNLSIKDQKIYLNAKNSSLETILKELSTKLKIRIRIIGKVDSEISGKIENASIGLFIRRISVSYAVVTSQANPKDKTYYVLPKSNIVLQHNIQDHSDSSQVQIEEVIEIAPDAAVEAAQQGLVQYISAAINDNPLMYGFSSDTELRDAKLDDPFRVYTLTQDKLLTAELSTSFDSLVLPTNQWFFPVMAPDDSYRSILAVDLLQGKWEAVSFGSSGLSIQLDRFVDQGGALQSRQVKFVRVYQAFSDLILRQQGKEWSIYPLESAVQSLQLDKKNRAEIFYSQEEILTALRIALKKKKKPFETE